MEEDDLQKLFGSQTTSTDQTGNNDLSSAFGSGAKASNVGIAEDVGRSMRAQAALAPADIIGLPGTIGLAARAARQRLSEDESPIYSDPLNLGLNKIEFNQEPEPPTAKELSGDYGVFFGTHLPTVQGVERKIKEAYPPAEYESTTVPGKIMGGGSRFASGAALTGGLAELPTFVKGVYGGAKALPLLTEAATSTGKQALENFMAGVGSESAGFLTENTEAEPYARFFGSVLGLGTSKAAGKALSSLGSYMSDMVQTAFMPNAKAKADLARVLAEDFIDNPALLSKVQEAVSNGATPNVFDYKGPKTDAFLKKMGYGTDETRDATAAINTAIKGRADASKTALGQHIEDTLGVPLDAGARSASIDQINKNINDTVYDLARNSPNAQSVFNDKLKNLLQIDDVKSAIRKTASDATDPQSGIKLFQEGKPGTPGSYVQTDRGIQWQAGTPAVPPQAPNLQFWDSVKQNIDDKISTALRAGENNEARRLISLKNRLTTEVDSIVPEYATARGAAAEGMGATNALEAGYNAMKNINAFKSQDVINSFNKMNDAQKMMAQEGVASFLKEFAETNGPEKLAKLMEKPNLSQRAKLFLGDENFNSIYGRAKSEAYLNKTAPITDPTNRRSLLDNLPSWGPGFTAGAGTAVYELLQHGAMDPASSAKVAIAFIGGQLSKGALNAAESKVAPEVMRLVGSSDKKDIQRLGQLAQENIAARNLIDKSGNFVQQTAFNALRSNPPPQGSSRPENYPTEGYARGGKVTNSKKQMLVKRLMDLAERAKKEVSKNTEPLLNAPDEAIVKALHVANQAI